MKKFTKYNQYFFIINFLHVTREADLRIKNGHKPERLKVTKYFRCITISQIYKEYKNQ